MDGGRNFTNPYDSSYNIQYNSSLRKNIESRQETSSTSANTRKFNNYNNINISPSRAESSTSSNISSNNDSRGTHIRFGYMSAKSPMTITHIKSEPTVPGLSQPNSYDYRYSNLENPDWPPNTPFNNENTQYNSNQSQSRHHSQDFQTTHATHDSQSHNSTKKFNNFASSQKSSSQMEVDLINIDDFDAESLFDNEGDGSIFETTQRPAHAPEYHSNENQHNQIRQSSNPPAYSQNQDKRPNDNSSSHDDSQSAGNKNKRSKPTVSNTRILQPAVDLAPMSPEDLTEAQIQDLLQDSIAKNDSIQSMKYFNMLKEVKSGINIPQKIPKQHRDQSTSSSRKQTNSQTNDLKEELDRIAAKQAELDLLKAKVSKLTEELERDRKKFLDMFQSKVPGGKNAPQEQTSDHSSARTSSVNSSGNGAGSTEKSREPSPEPRHSTQRSKTPERVQAHKKHNTISDVRASPAQNAATARPHPQQSTPTKNTVINSNFIKFTGFFNPETINVHKLDRVQDIKVSGYDDKLRFDPPYYKTVKQGRKCRSLILGNIKSPYGNRLNDIAITSCMNGIVTIYSGKDYDISTNLDLKDVNYRWAEDICFIQPDLVAVLAYSDSMRLAPTPVSLLTLKSQTSKGPIQPALLPIDIQTFTKPLSCITPINLDDEYIEFVTGGVDHKVSIWKLPKARKLKHMATDVSISSARIGHSSVVNSIAFDPQSKYIHSGGADCKYFITDPTKMCEIYSAKYASRINQIVVHPTMPHLQAISFATENKQFQLVDSRQNARKTIAHFGFQMDKLLTKYAKHSICNRGNLVACNDPTNNDILIWDLRYTKVDQEFQRFKSHDKKVNCVQFSPFKDSLIFSDENTQLGITDFSFN